MRGLLIVNLGSPDSPAPADVRDFLAKFLSDPRVVDFPRAIWLPILHGIVLRVRPKKSGAIYRSIWTPQGSPLVVYTKAQHRLLEEALPDWSVKYAMTYTRPSIQSALEAFEREGADDITVLPLYPHAAPSSSGAVVDQVSDFYSGRPSQPRLRIVEAWPTQTDLVRWHASQIARQIEEAEARPQLVLLSYHGVPMREVHRPRGYERECRATTSAIEEELRRLGVDTPVMTVFQSKFGPGKWLEPATIDTMAQLPGRGVKSVLLATPGFIADCIETIDELDVLNQDAFKAAGGEHYARVAPINDDPIFVDIVRDLLEP
ncbi:MAG: ferrochelatase [Actinomycetaceae bacterium]|nr:ferrochelatase [Actinomycetaceae bacterium]